MSESIVELNYWVDLQTLTQMSKKRNTVFMCFLNVLHMVFAKHISHDHNENALYSLIP